MNSRIRTRIAGLALLGLAAACSSSELSADDYDSSCSADSDCVTATFGEVCSLSCNPNGAIRKSEQAGYLADRADKYESCPEITYVTDPCEGQLRTIVAQCASGSCIAVDVTDGE